VIWTDLVESSKLVVQQIGSHDKREAFRVDSQPVRTSSPIVQDRCRARAALNPRHCARDAVHVHSHSLTLTVMSICLISSTNLSTFDACSSTVCGRLVSLIAGNG